MVRQIALCFSPSHMQALKEVALEQMRLPSKSLATTAFTPYFRPTTISEQQKIHRMMKRKLVGRGKCSNETSITSVGYLQLKRAML